MPPSPGRDAFRFGRRDLARVIESRMTEILTLVRRQADRSGLRRMMAAGVVLTGGGALGDGAVELAARIFDLPVRIGRPAGISGISEALDNPVFATGTGLALYGQRMRNEGRVSRFRRRGRLSRAADRLREWVGKRF